MTVITLESGLRLVLLPLPHSQTTAVSWAVRVGRRDDPDAQAGITYLLNRMMSCTTGGRPPLLHSSRIGVETNAEHSGFHLEVRPQRVLDAIDTLGELARRRAFGSFEDERALLLEWAGSHRTNLDLALREVWPDESLGRSVEGSPDTLALLSVEDLVAHQSLHYTALNSVVVVAGAFDAVQVREQVARSFAALSTRAPPARRALPPPRPGRLHTFTGTVETRVFIACPLAEPHDAQLPASLLLKEVVTYRLWHQLRARRGLLSGASDQLGSGEMAMTCLSLNIDDGRLASVLGELGHELAELRGAGPSEGELEQAREIMLSRAAQTSQDPGVVSRFTTHSELIAAPSHAAWGENLARCTAAQVHALAKRSFDPEVMHVLVFSELDEKEQQLAHERLVNLLAGRGPRARLVPLPRS